jgi:UDP-N-acetylglucosamine 2-epimerase (non-hydrolysing)
MSGLPERSIAVVLGTRPEAVKLVEVVERLGTAAWILHTGQHYDSSLGSAVLDGIGFPEPHEHLGLGGGTRAEQLGRGVEALGAAFDRHRPLAVVVQGDTNAVAAGALAANAHEIPVVHVEAGLRSFDRRMPEEHNRVVTDHLSDLCCAPTSVAAANLDAERIPHDRVVVTGNTVVEAVQRLTPPPEERAAVLHAHGVEPGGYVLSTIHRPENTDDRAALEAVLSALAELPVPVLLPAHPRTRARAEQFGLAGLLDRLQAFEPLPPRDFLALTAEAAVLVSDSGGVQEEVSVLKRPVVVVRRSTERPEVLGTFSELAPPAEVGARVAALLADLPAVHARLAAIESPYGDGSASRLTVDAIGHLVA